MFRKGRGELEFTLPPYLALGVTGAKIMSPLDENRERVHVGMVANSTTNNKNIHIHQQA